MLKLSKNHEVYEVWNEWVAESVFVDHKPTKDEVEQLVNLNWPDSWKMASKRVTGISDFIKRFIHVERLDRFYVTNPRTYRLERGKD